MMILICFLHFKHRRGGSVDINKEPMDSIQTESWGVENHPLCWSCGSFRNAGRIGQLAFQDQRLHNRVPISNSTATTSQLSSGLINHDTTHPGAFEKTKMGLVVLTNRLVFKETSIPHFDLDWLVPDSLGSNAAGHPLVEHRLDREKNAVLKLSAMVESPTTCTGLGTRLISMQQLNIEWKTRSINP